MYTAFRKDFNLSTEDLSLQEQSLLLLCNILNTKRGGAPVPRVISELTVLVIFEKAIKNVTQTYTNKYTLKFLLTLQNISVPIKAPFKYPRT